MIHVNKGIAPYSENEMRKRVLNNRELHIPDNMFKLILSKLVHVFHNKCAYCETKLAHSLNIDNYRPRGGARREDGTLDKEHYWWLAYEWSNLLPTCKECNLNKSNRFPTLYERVPVGTFELEELLTEGPIILNPSLDKPEDYLIYNKEGYVFSNDHRAMITIEILDLNRSALIDGRKNAGLKLEKLWFQLLDCYTNAISKNNIDITLSLEQAIKDIKNFIEPKHEYCAIKKYLLRTWLNSLPTIKEFIIQKEPYFNDLFSNQNKQINDDSSNLFDSFIYWQKELEYYDIRKNTDINKYHTKRRQIERVVIRNFRAIKELDFSLKIGGNKNYSAPWLMLLGENGTGKSTILQAIALTLMDESSRNKYIKDASGVLKKGEDEGFIKIFLSGSSVPVTLRFKRNQKTFFGENIETQRVILLGYGSTRLLPKRTSRKKDHFGILRVDNLFSPLHFLVNVSKQLYRLEDESFKSFIPLFKTLLPLENAEISRNSRLSNRIFVNSKNSSIELDELSDGYRSIIALVVDIIMALRNLKWNHDDGEAIVLIDELDAHLHPQWILKIVTNLRNIFPFVQFIVTSHDPLCLRGLDHNEILVLKRDMANELFIENDLPPQELLEVDKLLKSSFFGLNNTLDPAINSAFNEYYRLLVINERTEEDEEKLKFYRKKLIKDKYLGRNQREHMLFNIIDEYMAQVQYNPLKDIKYLKSETRKKVLEILTSNENLEGPPK
ncbi:AAA family ATPase [Peribacillus frigoritolerans]|uniref:AAA family ATPase n=1 Tax=Peribacillus frigoritolerans TaxID=450367 RepID=UPI003D34F110